MTFAYHKRQQSIFFSLIAITRYDHSISLFSFLEVTWCLYLLLHIWTILHHLHGNTLTMIWYTARIYPCDAHDFHHIKFDAPNWIKAEPSFAECLIKLDETKNAMKNLSPIRETVLLYFLEIILFLLWRTFWWIQYFCFYWLLCTEYFLMVLRLVLFCWFLRSAM